MSLISLKNIVYSVGPIPLLDNVDLEIHSKERIALIGRNGQGKSTLFKLLSKEIFPESGQIISSVKIARLGQELPLTVDQTVEQFVASGLKDIQTLVEDYYALSQENSHDEAWLNKLNSIQLEIDHKNGWNLQGRVEQVLTALQLPKLVSIASLSGGWKRRAALAQALIQEPDVLLLDEPTNHLDLEAIQWLEDYLLQYPKTLLFVTHDRSLLRRIATRILELDRGKIRSFPPNYDAYLQKKEQLLEEEERHNALFDKKLSEEEQWLRQGIKARRTRNEGRVRALQELRKIRAERRELQNKPKFQTQDVGKTGTTIIQAQDIAFSYNESTYIFQHFSFTIQRGDKIAIVGANGSGKTTLLKVLLGLLPVQEGKIKHSPTNQIAFFDQTRSELNLNATLIDNVAQGDDFIEIQGKKRHIIGYLGDFLFEPAKCRTLANTLSGGEQNRLLLAKLFAKPANILVLDEPTNDLDIESLEMLETLLLEYKGTVIVISHDREFIDNLATHCIKIEAGNIQVHVGGFTDWHAKPAISTTKPEKINVKNTINTTSKKSQKLSYHEQRELMALPQEIEKWEQEIKTLEATMCASDFYGQPKEIIKQAHDKLQELQNKVQAGFERWEELDSRNG